MAEGSAGVTWVVRASKQNDLPDGDNTLYTKHVILWQGHMADYTTLGIWWVCETESEVACGRIAWAVTKSRQDDRQQYTFQGCIQWKKNTEEKHWINKGDKLTDNGRAFGHWPLLCNDLGVLWWTTYWATGVKDRSYLAQGKPYNSVRGRQKQTFDHCQSTCRLFF